MAYLDKPANRTAGLKSLVRTPRTIPQGLKPDRSLSSLVGAKAPTPKFSVTEVSHMMNPHIHHTPLRRVRFFFGIDVFKTRKKGLHKYYKGKKHRMVSSEL